jgi:hypothetical protein
MKKRTFSSSCRLLAAAIAALASGGPPSAFADPSLVRIAVFDFELDDFSAGGGIAGDAAAGLAQLDRATSEARRVISQSGRYSLVDVSSAEGEGVKSRSLRACNGYEAAIALKLGADQSLVGVVTRIGRTECTVVPDPRRPHRRHGHRAAERSSHGRGLFLESRRGRADQQQLSRQSLKWLAPEASCEKCYRVLTGGRSERPAASKPKSAELISVNHPGPASKCCASPVTAKYNPRRPRLFTCLMTGIRQYNYR